MFAGCTQTVPKQRKTLKSQGFQGCMERNVNFDTMLPCVTFWVMVTFSIPMVTSSFHGNI